MQIPAESWKESLPGLLVSSHGRFFRSRSRSAGAFFPRLCPVYIGWERQHGKRGILRVLPGVLLRYKWYSAFHMLAKAWYPQYLGPCYFPFVIDGNILNLHPSNLRAARWVSWFQRGKPMQMSPDMRIMDQLIDPEIDYEISLLAGRMPSAELARQYMRPLNYIKNIHKICAAAA